MAEPGKTERWNSLLESLGVPASESPPPSPPPEPASKPQPTSLLPPKKEKPTPKAKAGPPPAKSPSYWSRIAGALGLDVGTSPTPAVEEPTSQRIEEPRVETPEPPRRQEAAPRSFDRPRRGEERHQRPSRQERPAREQRPAREERTRHEERPRHEERTPSSEPAGRSALDDMFGGRPSDVDVFSLRGGELRGGELGGGKLGGGKLGGEDLGGEESPRMREPGDARQGEDEDRGSVLEYDVPEGAGSDLALDRATGRGEIGREEINREEGPAGDGRRRRRRRGRGRRGRGEFRESGAPPQHEADIEPAGEEADFDLDRDEPMELESEIGPARDLNADEPEGGPWHDREEEPGRYGAGGERSARDRGERGGRGRRGRGRGRNRDRDRPAAERPAAYRGEEPPRLPPPRGEMAQRARDADDEIDEDLSAEMEEADEGRGGDVPTHKKIPTWDEAVGTLIDANMANRGPDRDRGYGRGRGRGRG